MYSHFTVLSEFLNSKQLVLIYGADFFSFLNSVVALPPHSATQPIVGVYFTALYWTLTSSRTRLLDHTQRRATVGRNPLN